MEGSRSKRPASPKSSGSKRRSGSGKPKGSDAGKTRSAGGAGKKTTSSAAARSRPKAKPTARPKAKATAKAKAEPKAKAAAKAKATPKPSTRARGTAPARQKARGRPGSKAKAEGGRGTGRSSKPLGLWFRASTRVRAAGYWLREKGQALVPLLRRAGEDASDRWLRSSRGARIGVAAGAGVLALLAFARFAPLDAIPCQVSAVNECAPADEAIAFVPADALLYAHVTLDQGTTQFERASKAFESLPDLRTIAAAELPAAVPTPSGAQVDPAADVLPWADRELALALIPGPRKTSSPVFIAGVGDRQGAEQFVAKIAPTGATPAAEKQGDAELGVYPGGFAAAYADDQLLVGDEGAVRAALKTRAGGEQALQDSARDEPREELPEARFAEAYLSRAGVRRLLAGRTGTAQQLETFVDYRATSGLAAALVAREGGIELDLVSHLDPKLAKANPSVFSELPDFEPTLADEAGERAIGYVGVGEAGPALAGALKQAGPEATGLAAALRSLAGRLEREAGVNPLQDLLPALGGQAALVAEPTDGAPFASLIFTDVDSEQADEPLARLQRPLLQALGTGGGAQVPRFEETEVDGVTINSVRASPTINLSYALFDDKLVISTDPAGVAQVRAGGDGLADAETFKRATENLPEQVSALVFLNLDELFGQVTRTDLVEDPFFANLSVLFDNASSLGLAVNGDDDSIRSELFLALD